MVRRRTNFFSGTLLYLDINIPDLGHRKASIKSNFSWKLALAHLIIRTETFLLVEDFAS